MKDKKEPAEGTACASARGGQVPGYTRKGREASLAAVSGQERVVRAKMARPCGIGPAGFVRRMSLLSNAMRRHRELIQGEGHDLISICNIFLAAAQSGLERGRVEARR